MLQSCGTFNLRQLPSPNAGIIVDAKSPLLKSQFASKSSVKRAGDAGEQNGKNAKKQAREAINNVFGNVMRIRIAVYFRKSSRHCSAFFQSVTFISFLVDGVSAASASPKFKKCAFKSK
jgi:hypothetical protein